MIKVLKGFYKVSEKKTYKVGEKASFDKETEKALVNDGFAEVVKEDKKRKVKLEKK